MSEETFLAKCRNWLLWNIPLTDRPTEAKLGRIAPFDVVVVRKVLRQMKQRGEVAKVKARGSTPNNRWIIQLTGKGEIERENREADLAWSLRLGE